MAILRSRQRRNKQYSALREQLKREDAAHLANLTPAERLQAALDLSDFCLILAAKVEKPMLNEALRKVVAALDKLGVPHTLIGGLAVAALGAVRATQDVNLIVTSGFLNPARNNASHRGRV